VVNRYDNRQLRDYTLSLAQATYLPCLPLFDKTSQIGTV
jgi:hypothetical protein